MLFFYYVCRKILRRFTNNALTVGAIALVLGGCMVGVAFLKGLSDAISKSAPPEHLIVTSDGAISELESSLSQDTVKQLAVLPNVKSENGRALVSPELVGSVILSTDQSIGKTEEQIILRGVEPIGLMVHGIRVVKGRNPSSEERELMVGAQLEKRHPELMIGSKLELPGGTYEVVGVFTAGGSIFEAEAWGGLPGLMRDLKQQSVSSAVVVAESAAAVAELSRAINESKRLEAVARPEREFREGAAGLERVQNLVTILVLMLCIVGLFATATNVDASLVTRLPEFATMIALGMRRNRVAALALQESLLLAMTAAIVGTALAALLHGQSTAIIHASATFDLSIGPEVVLSGILLGIAVGIAGGIFPALNLRKLDLVQGLR